MRKKKRGETVRLKNIATGEVFLAKVLMYDSIQGYQAETISDKVSRWHNIERDFEVLE